MSIYRMWHIGHHSEVSERIAEMLSCRDVALHIAKSSIVIDSKVLEDWLAEGLVIPRTAEARTESRGGALPSSTFDSTPVVGSSSGGQVSSLISPKTSLTLLEDAAVVPVTKESSPLPILTATILDNRDVVCCHGQLDPAKFAHMKRINTVRFSIVFYSSCSLY
jgi:hypothetical protein